MVNFMLVFSPWWTIFLKNYEFYANVYYYKDPYSLLSAENYLNWTFLRKGNLPTILNKALKRDNDM